MRAFVGLSAFHLSLHTASSSSCVCPSLLTTSGMGHTHTPRENTHICTSYAWAATLSDHTCKPALESCFFYHKLFSQGEGGGLFFLSEQCNWHVHDVFLKSLLFLTPPTWENMSRCICASVTSFVWLWDTAMWNFKGHMLQLKFF